MYSRNLYLTVTFALLFVFCDKASAQMGGASQNAADASKSGRNDRDDNNGVFTAFGDRMSEMRQKNRLREMEKDHDEMIQRGSNSAILGEQINKSFTDNKKLGSQEISKLTDLEKTLKKIRKSLGGSEDKEDGLINENRPQSMEDAAQKLEKISAELHENLKKSSPYTISASSIEEINDLLYIVDYLRLNSS
ncbi:MAG: hypothetical protein H7Z37_05475 [Pyrinomonadaceae bacterium]|nr:hypothetical protein [Pyrinomonadaceae bacterium]